ncbi:hypothetical protein HGB07_08325 [Candidatus Roizmanbacteria bacterium]|nr:hypothetical protein [Candidatus Roizmanbacteria bacterium]
MKTKRKEYQNMTNLTPWYQWEQSAIISDQKHKTEYVFKDFSKKEELVVFEHIDDFEYPSLEELEHQFRMTGLYDEEQLKKIIELYGRLPKYKAQCVGSKTSTDRSK